MLLVIEGRASIGRRIRSEKKVVGEFRNKTKRFLVTSQRWQSARMCEANLAELLGVRRPATVARIDRECIE
jgi:hypothetical protein